MIVEYTKIKSRSAMLLWRRLSASPDVPSGNGDVNLVPRGGRVVRGLSPKASRVCKDQSRFAMREL